MNAMFTKPQSVPKSTADTPTRKISFRTTSALPSFQETDEPPSPVPEGFSSILDGSHRGPDTFKLNVSDPIEIRKHFDSSHSSANTKPDSSSVSSEPIPINKSAIDVSIENLSPGRIFFYVIIIIFIPKNYL